MRTDRVRDRVRYNLAVLAHLQKLSPPHAEELNARGTARGWWDTVAYYWAYRRPPLEAAREIMKTNLEGRADR